MCKYNQSCQNMSATPVLGWQCSSSNFIHLLNGIRHSGIVFYIAFPLSATICSITFHNMSWPLSLFTSKVYIKKSVHTGENIGVSDYKYKTELFLEWELCVFSSSISRQSSHVPSDLPCESLDGPKESSNPGTSTVLK